MVVVEEDKRQIWISELILSNDDEDAFLAATQRHVHIIMNIIIIAVWPSAAC